MFFQDQFANVVEWEEFDEKMLFWKWKNDEIKKGSRLILRPGQAAIFMYNGAVEGMFEQEGSTDIESNIIPFLSTLKGFKFGFNSGLRAEVLFINKKEVMMNWGTTQPILVPSPTNPAGVPVRANGSFVVKLADYMKIIANIAGVKDSYSADDIRERIVADLDGLLMEDIASAGLDVLGLQTQTTKLAKSLKDKFGVELFKIGVDLVDFKIRSFSYPKEVQDMLVKSASQSMVGDMNRYSQIAMADSIGKGGGGGQNMGTQMASAMMGMAMAQQMMGNMGMGMNQQMQGQGQPQQMQGQMQGQVQPQMQAEGGGQKPNFCPNCGSPTNGANFCPNCGNKL